MVPSLTPAEVGDLGGGGDVAVATCAVLLDQAADPGAAQVKSEHRLELVVAKAAAISATSAAALPNARATFPEAQSER